MGENSEKRVKTPCFQEHSLPKEWAFSSLHVLSQYVFLHVNGHWHKGSIGGKARSASNWRSQRYGNLSKPSLENSRIKYLGTAVMTGQGILTVTQPNHTLHKSWPVLLSRHLEPLGLPENYHGGSKAIFSELGKPSTSIVI